MKQVQRVYEKRQGGQFVRDESCDPCTDERQVEHMLLQDMIAKHYWKCLYIRSIVRHQNYDGTCTYTVTYCDDGKPYGRAVYTVREH